MLVALESGRMVARKDSPIWQALGDGAGGFDDTLGTPYPPFAFGSGMGVEDVDRDTAMSLGLIDRDSQVTPQDRGFNAALQSSPSVRQSDLREALLSDLGDEYEFDGNVLRQRAAA